MTRCLLACTTFVLIGCAAERNGFAPGFDSGSPADAQPTDSAPDTPALPDDVGPDDLCPDDPAKLEPGRCGCGQTDDDRDEDGYPDCITWVSLTDLTGWSFTRSTGATDGAPELGLPAGEVRTYGPNEIREVSAKLALDRPCFLLEGERTNLLPRRADAWGAIGAPVVACTESDPLGAASACRIVAAGGSRRVQASAATLVSSQLAFSMWVRRGGGVGTYQAWVTPPDAAIGGIAEAPWVRVSRTLTVTSTNTNFYMAITNDGSPHGGIAAGERDAVYDLPQAEIGPWPSSAIPGTVAPSTRGADVAVADMPPEWTEGVLFLEYRPIHSSIQQVASGTSVRLLDDGVGSVSMVVRDGAVHVQLTTATTSQSGPVAFSPGSVVRVVVDWAATTLRVLVDGVELPAATLTAGWTPGAQVRFGAALAGGEAAFGALTIGTLR